MACKLYIDLIPNGAINIKFNDKINIMKLYINKVYVNVR